MTFFSVCHNTKTLMIFFLFTLLSVINCCLLISIISIDFVNLYLVTLDFQFYLLGDV